MKLAKTKLRSAFTCLGITLIVIGVVLKYFGW
jgi:hypothetical protein